MNPRAKLYYLDHNNNYITKTGHLISDYALQDEGCSVEKHK
jgi:hypothetical protein